MNTELLNFVSAFKRGDEDAICLFNETIEEFNTMIQPDADAQGITYSELISAYHVVYTIFYVKEKQKDGSDIEHGKLLINGIYKPITGEPIFDQEIINLVASEIGIKHRYDAIQKTEE